MANRGFGTSHALDGTLVDGLADSDLLWVDVDSRTEAVAGVAELFPVVSLTLLPATLIAGILGVNMLPKYLLHSWALWAGIGLMVVTAAVVLLTMRLLRHWL
jgi:Mg2+ and Co2+ transporter CorA